MPVEKWIKWSIGVKRDAEEWLWEDSCEWPCGSLASTRSRLNTGFQKLLLCLRPSRSHAHTHIHTKHHPDGFHKALNYILYLMELNPKGLPEIPLKLFSHIVMMWWIGVSEYGRRQSVAFQVSWVSGETINSEISRVIFFFQDWSLSIAGTVVS